MTGRRRRVKMWAARLPVMRIELDSPAAILLQSGVLFVALLRGLDYIALPEHVEVRSLTLVERALPFQHWGVLFVVAALFGFAGMWLRRWPVAVAGHGALVGIYVAFGAGALYDVAQRGEAFGWRTGAGWLLGGALAHAVLAEASLNAMSRYRASEVS